MLWIKNRHQGQGGVLDQEIGDLGELAQSAEAHPAGARFQEGAVGDLHFFPGVLVKMQGVADVLVGQPRLLRRPRGCQDIGDAVARQVGDLEEAFAGQPFDEGVDQP